MGDTNATGEHVNWDEIAKQAFEEYQSALKRITEIVYTFDPIQLLSRLSALMHFSSIGDRGLGWTLREYPILYFLVSVYLSEKGHGIAQPTIADVRAIVETVEKLYTSYNKWLMFNVFDDIGNADQKQFIQTARSLKIIHDVNPEGYAFQYEDWLKKCFAPFNNYFTQTLGFTPEEAWRFGNLILAHCEKAVNDAADKVNLYQRDIITSDQNPVASTESDATQPLDLLLDASPTYFVFEGLGEITATADDEAFQKYLQTLSCEFGAADQYRGLLDEGQIFTKPLIRLGNLYFAPLPQFLLFNLPRIFERILETTKTTNVTIWTKYSDLRGSYLENETVECLSRLLQPSQIYKNLKYHWNGELYESDILAVYDDTLLLVETKAGSLTAPAKRGGIERLKTDLKKLVEDAYCQATRTRNYITSVPEAVFVDHNDQPIITIQYDVFDTRLLLANVTLEPLLGLAIDLSKLQALELFDEAPDVWSVNLRELDILTRHIPTGAVLLHYIRRRNQATLEQTFSSIDELSYLGWYLKHQNFILPTSEDGEQPDSVSLYGWVDVFDELYVHGDLTNPIYLDVPKEIFDLLAFIERKRSPGYTRLIESLLDFPEERKRTIAEHIQIILARAQADGKRHDFTVFSSVSGIGCTGVVQSSTNNLRKAAVTISYLNKYRKKANRWICLMYDLSSDIPFLIDILYFEEEWQYDEELEKLSAIATASNAGKSD